MNYEVEIKVKVDPLIKKDLDKLASGLFVYKRDTYFSEYNSSVIKFRIRELKDHLIITVKENNRNNGLEINKETEVLHSIDDKDKLFEMANILGYKVLFTKTKEGFVYKYNNINVELLLVEPLGWFLELEIISKNIEKNDEYVNELYNFLSLLNISKDRIEQLSYQELLRKEEK